MPMNRYFIEEINAGGTYLELRILTYLECEAKMKKITEILNYLHANNFFVNLTLVYYENIRSENVPERQNVQSLTLDLRDDKFRFKFYDGAKTYWTYHTEDLFKIMVEGRSNFEVLLEKYLPVTKLLLQMRKEEKNSLHRVTYKYYPDPNIDVLYELEFKKDVKDTNVDLILKKIYQKINDLNIEDLNMDIDYSFQEECLPCQKAREKRELENKGKT